MISPFELPCVRCGRVTHLDSVTLLCTTIPEEGEPQPKPLCELVTCHEWSLYYWTENLDVTDDLEDAA
jgi:hypothetical protein